MLFRCVFQQDVPLPVQDLCVEGGLGVGAAVCDGAVRGGHLQIRDAAVGAAQGQGLHLVLLGQVGQAKFFEIAPHRVHARLLEAFQGQHVGGVGDATADGGHAAELAAGVADGGAVGVCGGSVVDDGAQCDSPGVQRRRVLPHDLDDGAGLPHAGDGPVEGQTAVLLSPATDDGLHLPGGGVHHHHGGLGVGAVPAVPVDLLLTDSLQLAVLGGVNGQAAPVEQPPGVLLRVAQPVHQIVQHLVDQSVLEIGQDVRGDAGGAGLGEPSVDVVRQGGVICLLRDHAQFQHLGKDQLLPLPAGLRVFQGVVVIGALRDARQHGALRQRQLRHLLAEVPHGRRLNAPGAAAQVDGVQVVLQDPLLGGLALQPQGQVLLLDFPLDFVQRRALRRAGGEYVVLDELLGDGAGALRQSAGGQVPPGGPGDTPEVDAGVLPEPLVLDGDEGVL